MRGKVDDEFPSTGLSLTEFATEKDEWKLFGALCVPSRNVMAVRREAVCRPRTGRHLGKEGPSDIPCVLLFLNRAGRRS